MPLARYPLDSALLDSYAQRRDRPAAGKRDMPTELSPRFQGEPGQHGVTWNELWKEGNTPWDKTAPSPALVALLESGRVDFSSATDAVASPTKIALVPGCGRGYDVDYIARALAHKGFNQVIGLDVSDRAVEAARDYMRERSSPASASVEVGDFFDTDCSASWARGVDLIYDYTFLCALHPSMRKPWGARMANLLVPGGLLITLQYPLDSHIGGPPFSLSTEIYDDLLLHNFDRILLEQPQEAVPWASSNVFRIAVYRRKGSG